MTEHRDIPDDGLHEPKGVASAAANQTYVSDGSGSGTWKSPLLQGQASSSANSIPVSDGLGGVTWQDGTVKSELLLRGVDSTSQNPPSTNNPIRVKFGTAQDLTDVAVDATGEVTIKTAGTYLITLTGTFGRATNAGVALSAARVLLNDVPALDPISVRLDDADTSIPFSFAFTRSLPSSTRISLQLVRDGSGIDEGGLVAESLASSGWGTSPSAAISIYKLKVYS